MTPIVPGTKRPLKTDWNSFEQTLCAMSDIVPNGSIGLCHAYSGTMCLDIDDWELARETLHQANIDLDALYKAPDSVWIDSGRPGHGKLLFSMPSGIPLPSKKLNSKRPDGQIFSFLEFRCATKEGRTVQDLLPPSIHPGTGQPYRWGGAHWSHMPHIPSTLLTFWLEQLRQHTRRVIPSDTPLKTSWEEVQNALGFISPDITRDDWITVGMGIHWAALQIQQLETGFSLWDSWSQGSISTLSKKYKGVEELQCIWQSFRSEGRTLASLFRLAKQNGWVRLEITPEALFASIGKTPKDPSIITDMLRPPAPAPDLNLWPPALVDRAKSIAKDVGCDPLVPLMSGLACITGIIDARTRLQLMSGFQVPPVLWLMIIGKPADKKSPGSRPLKTVIKKIERQDRERYKRALLEWEIQESRHIECKKEYIAFYTQPEAFEGQSYPAEVPELPPMPVNKKISIQDITSQKLIHHAKDRPEGLVCWLDEMHAWLRKITDRRSGEDRSAWVAGYESESYEMDRVGSGSLYCENLAVSIYGNVQPKVLCQLLSDLCIDGLMQRFFPVTLRASLTSIGEPTPAIFSNEGLWEALVSKLHEQPARTYTLSTLAHKYFREFQAWHLKLIKEDSLLSTNDDFQTANGKLIGLVGRLCLVFHLIESHEIQEVSGHLMNRVIRLAKDFIVPSLRYVYSYLGEQESLDYWLMNHFLARSDVTTFSLRDLKRSAVKRLGDAPLWQKNQQILDAMVTLENMHWAVKTMETAQSTEWVINPYLKATFKEHRREIIRIRQARLDENRRIAMLAGRALERRFVPGYIEEFGDR
ncbi:MAG: DUF3987 domain-containing protein [Candidatus Thiodiazotropha sp. (ex Lucinoma aequizonata)]|nr:DUF3987 domain-containing protein [Candidatus Thiodiazotropha sp. (ex Lucinoma aequizonata)]MCU7899667.1 DUF3987 domain-containing protein [Candidatus Thiodiazotropha sp. (ex Lucinoma aequizonata)]